MSANEGILAVLSSPPTSPLDTSLLNALTTVLRQAYATGRSSRPILYALIKLATSSDVAASYKCLAYEVLWTIVSNSDSSPLLSSPLLSSLLLSSSPLLSSAETSDVLSSALLSFALLSPPRASLLLAADDFERNAVQAMTGDAPSYVKALSINVFTRIAFTVAMQGAGGSVEVGVGSSLGHGCTPADHHGALAALRSRLTDKAMEIIRGTCNCLEDSDVEVVQAAFASLRMVLDLAPALASSSGCDGKPFGVLTPVNTLASKYFKQTDLTALPLGMQRAQTADVDYVALAGVRLCHGRVTREILRRVAPKLATILPKIHSLKDKGRAHAIRALTLVLAHLAADAGGNGRAGVLDVPTVLQTDNCAPPGYPSVHTLLHAWMTSHLSLYLRGQTAAAHLGGVGTGNTIEKSNASSQLSDAVTPNLSILSNIEACRSVIQLAMTWGPPTSCSRVAARLTAGHAAVADLRAVSVAAQQIDSSRSSVGSAAAASNVTTGAIDSTAAATVLNAASVSMSSAETADALLGDVLESRFAGSLWPILLLGTPPRNAASTLVAHAVSSGFHRILPEVMSCIFQLLRRVTVISPGATGAAIVVSTAGQLNGAGGSALNPSAANTAVITEPGLVAANGAPLNQNDPAVLAAAGAVVLAGNGLGSGASSPLISTSALHKLLNLGLGCLCLSPLSVLVRFAPAMVREIGRMPDDVVDDVGAGLHQSFSRVGLLLFSFAALGRAVFAESAPKHPLDAYIGGNEPPPRSTRGCPPPESSPRSPHLEARTRTFAPSRGPRTERGPATVSMSAIGVGSTPSTGASGIVSHSLLLPRIAYEATRPLTHILPDARISSATLTSVLSGLSAAGNVHANEVSACSIRFRCEVAAVVLQVITRSCPTAAVLTRIADVSRGTDAPHALTVQSRVKDAEAIHIWLSSAIDTLAANIWLLEHRLSYGGVGTMSRDQAAATLAKIMGQPDAPALCPAPVACNAPTSLYADVDGSAPVGDTSGKTGTSTAGSSAGIGFVTGWAWQREYEACVEASDSLLNLLTAVCAVLHPPALPTTYGSMTQAGHASPGASLSTSLALDMLPPALVALHRSRLSRVLYACSKADCGIYRMYELERAAQATAPKVAAAAAAAASQHSLTASITRGSTFDVLPSAIPMQLRILWLLACVWDGTDGVTSTASGVGGGISNILTNIQPTAAGGGSTTSSVAALQAVGSAASVSGLAITATDALLRHSTLAPTSLQTALKDVLSKAASPNIKGGSNAQSLGKEQKSLLSMALTAEETASFAVEALRQKRLAALVGMIAGEAGVALNIGVDLEGAGNKVVALLAAAKASGAIPASNANSMTEPEAAVSAQKSPVKAPLKSASGAGTTPSAESSSWLRGSKIGKAFGFFGSAAGGKKEYTSVVSQPVVYSGESTVVTYAHFWLLIDMLSQLAASQRCCAGQIKRAVECMLVQPKLSTDVAHTLLALLPRLSLFAAAYGRSSVAKELAVLDTANTAVGARGVGSQLGSCGPALRVATTSASILAAVAAEAHFASRDPWSFTHYNPVQTIGMDGTVQDVSKESIVAAALAQLGQYKRLVGAQSKRDAPVGVSALEVMSDMLSPPTLALIAAAAAPDLTQNATLGLNRSSATGARMRTVPPISAAHMIDASTFAAAIAMEKSKAVASTSSLNLPATFLGSVPANLTDALEDAQRRLMEMKEAAKPEAVPNRVSKSIAAGTSAIERTGRLVDSFLNGDGAVQSASVIPRLPVLSPLGSVPAFSEAERIRSLPRVDVDSLSVSGSGASDGIVVTSAADPVQLIMSHVCHADSNRMSINVRVVNESGFRLPAGLKVRIQLSGPLTFDRSAITASQISSSSQRLGASSVGNNGISAASVNMGTSATSSVLQADLVTMQRGSCSHATFTVTRSLPLGFNLGFTFILSVCGFGSVAIRPVVVFECVEVNPALDATDDSIPGYVATAARIGRIIGATAQEEATGDDGEELDWSRAGTTVGGVNASWGTDLAPATLSVTGDGLIWSGTDLNLARKGKFLTGLASSAVSISRSSANKAAASAGSLTAAARVVNATGEMVMREWSARDTGSPSVSVKTAARRHSGVSSVVGGFGGGGERDREGDADSAAGDDDNGSIASSGTTGIAPADLEIDSSAESAQAATRPYAIRRIEIVANCYRVKALNSFLRAVDVRMAPGLALAIACGVDVLPGAASRFGLSGAPSKLAAASIEGGGMMSASVASGTAMASASGSVVSINNALFACTMARLPYAHYGVAVSTPLVYNGSANADSTAPNWVASLLSHGLGASWTRIPLPLSPEMPPDGERRGILNVAQMAFTSSTWSGNTVALFATCFLVSTSSSIGRSAPLPTPASAAPQTCAWQVSFQLRCEDARTRAAFAAEFPDVIHTASHGRFMLVSHGHSPSPVSLLQHVEIMTVSQLEKADQSMAVSGSSNPLARAQDAAGVSEKLGIGLMPLLALPVTKEMLSSGQYEHVQVRNSLGASIFNVIPEDLLQLLANAPIDTDDTKHEEGIDLVAQEVMSGAPATVTKLAANVTGATVTMRLDDFFSATSGEVSTSSSNTFASQIASPTLTKPISNYDPFA